MSKHAIRRLTRTEYRRQAKLDKRIAWAIAHPDYQAIVLATLDAHDIHSGMGFRAVYVHKPKKRLNKVGPGYRIYGKDLMGRTELRKHKGKWVDVHGNEFHISKPTGNDVIFTGDGALELSLRDRPEESDLLDDNSPVVHVANTKYSRTQGREPRGNWQKTRKIGNEPTSLPTPHVTAKRRKSKPTGDGEREAQDIIAASAERIARQQK